MSRWSAGYKRVVDGALERREDWVDCWAEEGNGWRGWMGKGVDGLLGRRGKWMEGLDGKGS